MVEIQEQRGGENDKGRGQRKNAKYVSTVSTDVAGKMRVVGSGKKKKRAVSVELI